MDTQKGSNLLFLVGAGRSGTTLLYKLLCLHPEIAFISNYENRLPWLPKGMVTRAIASRTDLKLWAWFNQGGNAYFIDRPWSKKLFPTPVEGEQFMARHGMPLFPDRNDTLQPSTIVKLRKAFEQIRVRVGARMLVSKRTANNRRIPQLEAAFPAARYVNLVRDGRDVTYSLSKVDWWDRHTLWWDGRTAAELEQAGMPRLSICARNWVREIEELDFALASVDRTRVLHVRYEDLLAQPLEAMSRICGFADVPFSAEYADAVAAINLGERPHAWESRWNDEQLSCVLSEARPTLEQTGYLS